MRLLIINDNSTPSLLEKDSIPGRSYDRIIESQGNKTNFIISFPSEDLIGFP